MDLQLQKDIFSEMNGGTADGISVFIAPYRVNLIGKVSNGAGEL